MKVGLNCLQILQVSTIAWFNLFTCHHLSCSINQTTLCKCSTGFFFMWPCFVMSSYCSSFAASNRTNPPYIAMSRLSTVKLPLTVSFISIQFQCIPICWFLGMFNRNSACWEWTTKLCALTRALPWNTNRYSSKTWILKYSQCIVTDEKWYGMIKTTHDCGG